MNQQDAVLAGRYAAGLFQAARDAGAVDAVREDLAALARALRTDAAFAAAIGHPRGTAADKAAAVKKALGRAPDALTERFVALLLAKKRLSLLAGVEARVQALADEAKGLVRAQVRAASVLTDAQAKALAGGVEKALGKKVALEVAVDPSLLGGAVVRVGDRLWDLSLKGRLERLKEQLLETASA